MEHDTKADETNLTGKVLIAMPGMSDARFAKSVVLICAHSDDGAMGLVLNHPLPELDFADLLEQLGIDADAGSRGIEVRFGGPVEPGRGFVLHRVAEGGADPEGVLRIGSRLAMTTTRDILEDIAHGTGPDTAFLALGYAGWGPGQLEAEMAQNGWLTGEGADDLIFGDAHDGKWASALRAQGIEPSLLSGTAGRA
ncbi:MAG: YqgE/AlgH family protein [Paracoccus sp. (in: a-proteobacteria)]|uniref:YqgE/AlgH family protein n=1 Tax=Paracoccus sp. TaxID=267 RepID=UPI0026DED85C|nr:YqgE/AlgH family protein [Paracoccus sp. (in: a-proteobacteria)]MDO5612736.1 YqgE/AlgH family protein [Paracoccus sp. (in: a-proteobacteria)]